MNIRQCYKILEIGPNVSIDQLNEAYKDLVAVWHPDRFSNNHRLRKKAEDKLKTINEAYEKILAFMSSEPTAPSVSNAHIEPNLTSGNSYSNTDKYQASLIDRKSDSKIGTGFDIRPHPWVRLSARIIDYILFAGFLGLIHADDILPDSGFRTIIFPALLTFAWIIPEAIMLHLFGATPGKWILRTSVSDMFLLKPNFSDALRRSLSVWCNGVGMGVPFIALFTAGLAFYRLKTKKKNAWDRDRGFSVKHGKVSRFRFGMALFASATIVFVLIFGSNIMVEIRRQAVRLKPDDPTTHLNLGASYAKVGHYDEAIKAYKHAIKIKPRHAQAHYTLGRCYLDLEQYEEALAPLEKAAALDPDNPDILYFLGTCYANLNRTIEAINAYSHAVKIKPDHVRSLYSLGKCHMALKRYQDAIEVMKQTITLNPTHAHAHYSLGICYAELGLMEDAIERFQTALDLQPNYAQAHTNLGEGYIKLGRYNDAIEPFKRAITLRPDDPKPLYGLGVCYAKLRLYDKALESLKQAVKIKPDYAQAYHILGLTYLSLEKRDAALEQYEYLNKLDTGLAKELSDYIESMTSSKSHSNEP